MTPATALAPYAATEKRSRGRARDEPHPRFRGEYQRDRDRIIHSGAFRRLEYKTQVFVNHEGDMFRTRLTHSIEVAQIARTVARALRLNEDLTEAIALAHDLGHTPFGHAGQEALNHCMRAWGGFEHNLQSLRIVDLLEQRYAAFVGLNLTFESREGVLKHCSRKNAERLGPVGERFLSGGQPSLEAQVANLCDEIAYNNHDLDDGLRAGLLDMDELDVLPSFAAAHRAALETWPALAGRRLIHETIRRMIDHEVTDLIEASQRSLKAASPESIDAVRSASDPLIAPGAQARDDHLAVKRFLRERLYRHYRVHRMTVKARRIVSELFEAFSSDRRLLPDEARASAAAGAERDGHNGEARAVADYIAGMTDRYAIGEHRRLFGPAELT
ncbi:MAG: deoxyguanosinetriphosphate triphosphohydrolase [Gammaproteobacteria bacterium]